MKCFYLYWCLSVWFVPFLFFDTVHSGHHSGSSRHDFGRDDEEERQRLFPPERKSCPEGIQITTCDLKKASMKDALAKYPDHVPVDLENPDLSPSDEGEIPVFKERDVDPLPYIIKKHAPDALFAIHREKNNNVCVYSANYKNEEKTELHPKKPIKVFWIMFEKKDHPREDLIWYEDLFAYGVRCKAVKERDCGVKKFKVNFAFVKDRSLELSMENGEVSMKTDIGGAKDCKLRRIFIESKDFCGLNPFPVVDTIELFGNKRFKDDGVEDVKEYSEFVQGYGKKTRRLQQRSFRQYG